jgi:hypothetical protein
MPCRVDGPFTAEEIKASTEREYHAANYKKQLEEKVEQLTRFLCEYDRKVDELLTNTYGPKEKSVLILSKELTEWLKEHRISDAKRKKNAMVDFEALAKKLGYNLKKIEIE